MQLGDGPQQMLVLAVDSGGRQLWTSRVHIVIATRDGRIVSTVGLPHDLSDLTPGGGDAMPAPDAIGPAPVKESMRADYRAEDQFSVTIACRAKADGPESITILGQAIRTRRIVESCRAPLLDWHFTNTYWIDPSTGLVWRSVQYLHPDMDPVTIETLRPPQIHAAQS